MLRKKRAMDTIERCVQLPIDIPVEPLGTEFSSESLGHLGIAIVVPWLGIDYLAKPLVLRQHTFPWQCKQAPRYRIRCETNR